MPLKGSISLCINVRVVRVKKWPQRPHESWPDLLVALATRPTSDTGRYKLTDDGPEIISGRPECESESDSESELECEWESESESESDAGAEGCWCLR